MFKEYFIKKINFIDGMVTVIPIIWFLINRISNKSIDSELTINLTFLVLLVTLFIFRSSNLRHMYLAFVFLILSVIGSVFNFDDFVYLSSSLVLSLLILGTLNMLLFRFEE